MTAINAASAAIYLKGFPIREKVQTYALAIIFFILLYNSPSGLVLYWTVNNLFSLAKNAVLSYCKRPSQFVYRFVSILVIILAIFILAARPNVKLWKRIVILCFSVTAGIALEKGHGAKQFCAISKLFVTHNNDGIGNFALLLSSNVALALLLGLVLPSSSVATSPAEFQLYGEAASPLFYVWRSFFVFTGLFVLWPLVIYKMFGAKAQRIMPFIAAFALVMALLDAYVFKFQYGTMDVFFHLDDRSVLSHYSVFHVVCPLIASVVTAAALHAVRQSNAASRNAAVLIAALCVSEASFAAVKMRSISNAHIRYSEAGKPDNTSDVLRPIYHLSKEGQNVVVIFLDRAVGSPLLPLR